MPERYLSSANTSSSTGSGRSRLKHWVWLSSHNYGTRGGRSRRTRGVVCAIARHDVLQNRKVPETLGSVIVAWNSSPMIEDDR